IMREISIHLEDELVAVRERPAKARDVGGAEPELAGAMEDMDARILRGEPVEQRAGPVRAPVVHEQDAHVRRSLRRHGGENGVGDREYVVALIVGGDDDERARADHETKHSTYSNPKGNHGKVRVENGRGCTSSKFDTAPTRSFWRPTRANSSAAACFAPRPRGSRRARR